MCICWCRFSSNSPWLCFQSVFSFMLKCAFLCFSLPEQNVFIIVCFQYICVSSYLQAYSHSVEMFYVLDKLYSHLGPSVISASLYFASLRSSVPKLNKGAARWKWNEIGLIFIIPSPEKFDGKPITWLLDLKHLKGKKPCKYLYTY